MLIRLPLHREIEFYQDSCNNTKKIRKKIRLLLIWLAV